MFFPFGRVDDLILLVSAPISAPISAPFLRFLRFLHDFCATSAPFLRFCTHFCHLIVLWIPLDSLILFFFFFLVLFFLPFFPHRLSFFLLVGFLQVLCPASVPECQIPNQREGCEFTFIFNIQSSFLSFFSYWENHTNTLNRPPLSSSPDQDSVLLDPCLQQEEVSVTHTHFHPFSGAVRLIRCICSKIRAMASTLRGPQFSSTSEPPTVRRLTSRISRPRRG